MRKLIITVASCIALLLLGYVGFRGYRVWKQGHLMTMAKAFSAKSDINNEVICLRQVLLLNPRNLDACRMMAGLTEAVRSPAALIWRQRILELVPNSVDDRLALAKTGILFRDFATATNALAGLEGTEQNNADYQNLAGVVAITLGQAAAADRHFSEAARLEPANPAPRLNLAVVRLHGSNALDLAEARIELKRISLTATNASLRSQATRELIGDAMRSQDNATALTLCQELTKPTNAAFSDKLLQLGVLKESRNPAYQDSLMQCQREAGAEAAKLAEMAGWLLKNATPTATLTWLHSLPGVTQTNQPAAVLISQCQILMQDWNGLQAALAKQDWSELEYLRHAFLARALRGQKLEGAATAEWEVATKFASGQKGTQIALFQLAAQWGWIDEAEEILWAIVNRYPDEPWASQSLQRALYLGGRTRSLMQLFALQLNRTPNDMDIKNNLALTAMLLNAQELNPYQLARAVYDQNPLNPSFASTYAFSLYLQKQYGQALKVMQKLTPQQLNTPSVAGYYGLILKATGDNNKAKAYFSWAAKGQLLPEEKKLFDQAASN